MKAKIFTLERKFADGTGTAQVEEKSSKIQALQNKLENKL